MKFLFVSGREIDYTRNQVLIRALCRIGEIETVTIRNSVKSLILRSILLSLKAFPKYISRKFDFVFVGFYGHLLMLPIGALSRRPVIFDAFLSTYDTLTSDRQVFSPRSVAGRLAFSLDRYACFLADNILVDTPAQVDYFSSTLGVQREKLASLPVSCNEAIFFPRKCDPQNDGITKVLSYSTYLPIHGTETIIRAAASLRNESIHFKMIGKGPLFNSSYQLAGELGLENITFNQPVALQQLSDEIAASDICLGGHFGQSDKARRVIPGKIYQMMAMQKPIIAADVPVVKELLSHRESAYLCTPGDPDALADAIRVLHQNPQLCNQIAYGGREVFQNYCSEAVVTEKLQKIILEIKTK